MKRPQYFLMGYRAAPGRMPLFGGDDQIRGSLKPLLAGNADEVIAAAAAAPCGVLLYDLGDVPTLKSLTQGNDK